jgi:hypothetical protein
MSRCQFGTNQSEPCSRPANYRVLFGGEFVGRLCAGHRQPFKDAYGPSARISFEPMGGRPKGTKKDATKERK